MRILSCITVVTLLGCACITLAKPPGGKKEKKSGRFPSFRASSASAAESDASAAALSAATKAASQSQERLVQTRADAAQAQGAAGAAEKAAADVREMFTQVSQALLEAQQAHRCADQAARDAAVNARHIRNMTPIICAIGAYCLYTSIVFAPDMKRHYQNVMRTTLQRVRKTRRMVAMPALFNRFYRSRTSNVQRVLL